MSDQLTLTAETRDNYKKQAKAKASHGYFALREKAATALADAYNAQVQVWEAFQNCEKAMAELSKSPLASSSGSSTHAA